MKSKLVEQVEEFHRTFDLPIIEEPTMASQERFELRYSLIFEELCEFSDAIRDNDIISVADALGDLLYVVIGAALEYGIPLDDVVTEIHKSNMSKLDETGNQFIGILMVKFSRVHTMFHQISTLSFFLLLEH